MYTAAIAGQNDDGLHGLFERCNELSTLPYEGKPGQGRIAIARVGHPNIETMLRFADPVSMQDARAIRKLLQLCGDNLFLLSDSAFVYGLGRFTGQYNSRQEDLFIVRFSGHYHWQLWHADYCLMRIDYDNPTLPRLQPMDEIPLKSALARTFASVSNEGVERICVLARAAANRRKGGILVIASNNRQKCTREQLCQALHTCKSRNLSR